MFLFKTSGSTFSNVIKYQKHAFCNEPRDWMVGERVLVSKNRVDTDRNEKQIQYFMQLKSIRKIHPGEAEMYWPGNEGRWNYLVICENTMKINEPFDLKDILGESYLEYSPVVTFKKIQEKHGQTINSYLAKVGFKSI